MARAAEAVPGDAIPAETIASLKTWSRAAGIGLALLGACVLLGWLGDVAVLYSLSPTLAPMKPNTACCFVLFGGALWFDGSHRLGAARYRKFAISALLVIALLTLLEHTLRLDLHIDRLLLLGRWRAAFPERMSLATSLSFLLLALALVTLDSDRERTPRLPHVWLATAVALCALFELLGYAYGVRTL